MVEDAPFEILHAADEPPFEIHSDSKITLRPEAREFAKLWGMTEDDLGRHLLGQARLRRAGYIQRHGES